MATAAMARMSRLWTSSSISYHTKYRLYKSVTRAHKAGYRHLNTNVQRKLLRISHTKHNTNVYFRNMPAIFVGQQEPLLSTVKTT
ncbi:hypothetical protein DPMN_118326 [Dreissena polymorpha]|uniref:Uncharacterized protein n=1 Tax=Dreissena polymorpha TaxID=45954 RepID=A0A9D4GH92_DREPO|nr:hypothetical protein DPMN_118326 [Dreissena polymorpha]